MEAEVGESAAFPLGLSLSLPHLPPSLCTERAGGGRPPSQQSRRALSSFGLLPLSSFPSTPHRVHSPRSLLPCSPGKAPPKGAQSLAKEERRAGGHSGCQHEREGGRAPFLPSLSPRCTAHSPFPSGAPRPLLPFPTSGEPPPPPKPRGAKREGATTRPLRSLGKGGWGHS